MTAPYPHYWPRPDPTQPKALHSRISEADKEALFNRLVTTRELAKRLQVNEKYLSARFPGKIPTEKDTNTAIIQARKEYKIEIGKRVLQGDFTIREAAKLVHCSWNTMYRYVAKAKVKYPELGSKFAELVNQKRKAGYATGL